MARLATCAASDAVVSAQVTQQQYLAHYNNMIQQFGQEVAGTANTGTAFGSAGSGSGSGSGSESGSGSGADDSASGSASGSGSGADDIGSGSGSGI